MSNQAAWITGKQVTPLEVKKADIPKPGKGQMVFKSGALAINPVDWKIQEGGYFVEKFPNVLGCDAAGEVYEVGEGVTQFKKGDRVLSHCVQLLEQNPAEGGLQLYPLVRAIVSAKIPDSMSFEEATVLPLAVSTAAAGLYIKGEALGLPYPSLNPQSTGKTLLVWGGSTSVGSAVIQLAKASGLDVVTTSSSRNFEFCKSLGASQVFDYTKSDVVDQLVSALKGKQVAGAYDSNATPDTIEACAKVLAQVGGGHIATTLPPPQEQYDGGVTAKSIFAAIIAVKDTDVAEAVWGKFLPEALANGSFQAKPDPLVVGKGLEKVQEAFEVQRKGVSAKKVVVSL